MKKQRKWSVHQDVQSRGGFIIPGPEARVLWYDWDEDEVEDWGMLQGFAVFPDCVLPISEDQGAPHWPEALFALEMPDGRVHTLKCTKHHSNKIYASRYVWQGYLRT